MMDYDYSDLESSVVSFKETVDALTKISDVEKALEKAEKEFDVFSSVVKEASKKIDDTSASLASAFADFQDRSTANIDALEKNFAEHEKILSEQYANSKMEIDRVLDNLNNQAQEFSSQTSAMIRDGRQLIQETVETIESGNKSLSSDITEYTSSTLKAVEELRINGLNNARETRDKIVEIETKIHMEQERQMDSIAKLAEQLTVMQQQQKSNRSLVLFGSISAFLALLASILHFFL